LQNRRLDAGIGGVHELRVDDVNQGELRADRLGQLAPDIDGVGGNRLAVDGDKDLLESQDSLPGREAA
jgi:hypothetical protein